MSAPFSERLELIVQLGGARLRSARERLWSHPRIAELYPGILFRMHSEARASLSLMQAAVDRLEPLGETDPLARGVAAFLRHLIPEERGHDGWLLDGLEALGISRQEVWQRRPPARVATLVGEQYYWIHHHHPVALLGYIKVVEHGPAPKERIDAVRARLGLPRGAFRYHYGHARLELKHNRDLDDVLDALPLDNDAQELIVLSVCRTLDGLAACVEDLVDTFERERLPALPPVPASPADARPALALF